MGDRILLLHPGEMGSSIGAALCSNGHTVFWVVAGRSAATEQRAHDAGLIRVANLKAAVAEVDHVISVCPPHAALDVGKAVANAGFDGIYVDANAVSPATARRVYNLVGTRFVDGGIIGPPAWRTGTTRLYLSGIDARRVAALFAGTLVDARVIEGSASAVKTCYAAYTKGSAALLLATRALAASQGVTEALLGEWEMSQPGLTARSAAAAVDAGRKAWRFNGEMLEIAETFADSELPSGFHESAAEVYRRLSDLKEFDDVDMELVLETLRRVT